MVNISRRRFAQVALVLVALAGCATPRHVVMSPEAPSKIKATEVVIGLSQQEITAEIAPSGVAAAAGGGLIPALIDIMVEKSRAGDAEAAIAPVKNALIDYDFAKQLQAALENEFRQLSWLNLQGFRTEASPDATKVIAAADGANASVVLVISARYMLSADFSQMRVRATATGYPKTEELVALAKKTRPDDDPAMLYRNDFTVQKALDGAYPNLAARGNAWGGDGGKRAREALNGATAELAARIATDLESARRSQEVVGIAGAETGPQDK